MPIYEFYCEACEETTESIFKSSERPDHVDCGACGRPGASFRISRPAMFRVQFEQHGRVGYSTDLGNGKKTYRSATRERYEHEIGNASRQQIKEKKSELNRSVYTKEYGQAVEKAEKEKMSRLDQAFKEATKKC